MPSSHVPRVDRGPASGKRRAELLEEARQISWYHTIQLDPELVTEGEFDLRPHVAAYGLPERMAGMRALDVATFDGFWAFEMERRGAEVVALDLGDASELDWPASRPRESRGAPLGAGFAIAAELLGSRVPRIERNVYDLDPRELGGFDLVLCGSLLIHLKNPVLALERIRGVLRDGGTLVSAEPYSRLLGALPFGAARYRADRPGAPVFWEPSLRGWRVMLRTCGFAEVERRSRFTIRSPRGYAVRHCVHHARCD